MSGLEIVGIILGILPVLEKAAKASKVAEKVSFFRSFRSKFNDFLASILAALISYRQNIKFLLGPLGLEPEVVAELVDGPDKLGTWADPGFQSRLKSRFGDDEKLFGWLIGQLIEVKTIIDDLNTLLCNFVAEAPRSSGIASIGDIIDHQQRKLVVSFSSKRHLVAKFKRINDDIFLCLDKELKIYQSSDPGVAAALASKRHDRICSKKAKRLLELQQQVSILEQILHPAKWSCSCLLKHSCGISVSQPLGDSEARHIGLAIGQGNLTKHVEMQYVGNNRPKESIQRSGLSNISHILAQQSLGAKEERRDRLRKERHVSFAVIASTKVAFDPLDAGSQSSKQSITGTGPFTQSPRASESMKAVDHATPYHTASTPKLSGTGTNPGERNLEVHSKPPTDGEPAHKPSEQIFQSMESITCDFLHEPLPADRGIRLHGHATGESWDVVAPKHAGNNKDTTHNPTSLAGFYGEVFQLDQRLRLGIKLAYSIISLGNSSWFPQECDDKGLTILRGIPFYKHDNIRIGLNRWISDSVEHAESAMFTLGMIILQLLFQQSVQEQEFWVAHCRDGKEVSSTLKHAVLQWQRSVEPTYGPDLAKVVYRCVSLDFSHAANLGEKRFIYEVLTTVIEPLETFVMRFGN